MSDKMEGIGRIPRKRESAPSGTEERENAEQQFEVEDPAITKVTNEIIERHRRELDADMDYHNSEHPRSVWGRMQILAKILNIDNHTMNVAFPTGNGHDLVQDADIPSFDPADLKTIIAKRVRHRGMYEGDNPPYGANGNEGRTSKDVITYLDAINKEAGREIYTEKDKELAEFLLACTYPEFGFNAFNKPADPDKETPKDRKRREYYEAAIQNSPQIAEVLQELQGEEPEELQGEERKELQGEKRGVKAGLLIWAKHLDDRLDAAMEAPSISQEEARFLKAGFMMSQADLGSSVMEESEKFFLEGDKEFIESYPPLKDPEAKKVLMTEGGDSNDEHSPAFARKLVAGEMLKWLNIQVGVAVWQGVSASKHLMQMEQLGLIDSLQRADLATVCGHADDNARSTAFRAEPATSETDELYGERGSYERALAGKPISQEDGTEIPGNEYTAFMQLAHAMHYHPEA